LLQACLVRRVTSSFQKVQHKKSTASIKKKKRLLQITTTIF